MPQRDENNPGKGLGKAGAYMGMPFVLLVSIGVGYYGGTWIDEHYGTSFAQFTGMVLGFALGLYEIIRMSKQIEKK